ncbi:hypothetical protein [Marinobacter segnicrescens]|uniref:hypothetical protein n=1 Tax=Marinobacter segnicrescens TaxID=430453 RepID=UPI003A91CE92
MTKKVEIRFEDSGTQVDAYYFGTDILKKIEEMVESGDCDEGEIVEFIQSNNKRTISVSKGMYIHSENLKCQIKDGDDVRAVSIMPIQSDDEDMSYQDWIEENDLEDAEAILVADESTGIFLSPKDDPSIDEHVILDITNYDYGQLVGYIEVDDDLVINDIDIGDFSIQLLNVDGEGVLSEITYGEGTIGTEHEDEIYKLTYKGQEIELNLNFQGGSSEIQLFLRDEDDDLVQTDIDELCR